MTDVLRQTRGGGGGGGGRKRSTAAAARRTGGAAAATPAAASSSTASNRCAVTHPEKHDFVMCPVKIATQHQFPICNTGSTAVSFRWEVPKGHTDGPPPFIFNPESGTIGAGQTLAASVSFFPQAASVFVAAAVLRCTAQQPVVVDLPDNFEAALDSLPAKKNEGKPTTSVFMLSGIGKFPFVKASATSIEFGEVFIGKSVEKKISLKNHGQVPAHFKIEAKGVGPRGPEVCSFQPSTGVIRPEGTVSVQVVFRPTSCALHSLNEYTLQTVGGSDSTISVSGVGFGPDLTITTKRLHFGEVDLAPPSGKAPSRPVKFPVVPEATSPRKLGGGREKVVVLENSTKFPAAFQVLNVDRFGSFRITPAQGVVGPGKALNLRVFFEPSHPLNYYRRVYILSAGSVEPLWIDLMGSAFLEQSIPPRFTYRHVAQMRAREMVGLARLTPDEMEKLLDKITKDEPCIEPEEQSAREALIMALDPPAFTTRGVLASISRTSDMQRDAPFSLELSHMDFGVVKTRGGETRRVDVFNHTAAKATAVWPHAKDAPFDVHPASQDVPPFSSASFSVTARGMETTSPLLCNLECYTYFKTMRSFRLVSDECVMPPTCLTLSCIARGEGRPTPVKASVSVSRIDFPPVHVGDVTYQTIALRNDGDVPSSYTVQYGSTSSTAQAGRGADADTAEVTGGTSGGVSLGRTGDSISEIGLDDTAAGFSGVEGSREPKRLFSVFPEAGVVPPHQGQVLLLKFHGAKPATYRGTADIVLDSMKSAPLFLHGASFTPSLLLRNDATVYFKPTFTNSTTTRPYCIENPCRIDVAYKWDIPAKYRNVIKVEPDSGILRGNEKKNVKLSFTPDRVNRYVLNIPIACSSTSDAGVLSGNKVQSVTVVGEGTTGSLTLEPFEMCFDTVLAGGSATRTIDLYNSTACETAFCIGWFPEGGCEMHEGEVTVSEPVGVLPLRTHKTIRVVFKPQRRGRYCFRVYCKAVNDEKQAWDVSTRLKTSTLTPEEISVLPSCLVNAEGGYPAIEITDIRCPSISKAHLWEQASIDGLNATLGMSVQAADADARDFEFQSICAKHEPHPVNFGAAVVNSQSTKILITLENVSELPVHFRFTMPNDNLIPTERWFHEVPPTQDALHQEHVLDSGLFAIQPRSASIPPHETITLQLSYKRSITGEHTLPVILKVRNGKCVLLVFKGKTLQEGDRHLDMLSDVHLFSPVCIGDTKPPMQYVELQNTSLNTVTYELDKAPFVELYETCFDFPVMQCLNSKGEVPPLCSTMLQWYFRPLEAKTYEMKVNILVHGGATYTMTLRGTGYHPHDPETQKGLNPEFKKLRVFPTLAPTPLFPLVLSQDVLEFGRVSVHSLHRRILILRNTHKQDPFSFEWNTEGLHGEQLLEMYPVQGVVQAGEFVVCRLTMYSGSLSQVIDQSIQCKVVNQGLLERRAALQQVAEGEAALALDPEDGGSEGAPPHETGDLRSGTPTTQTMDMTSSVAEVLKRGTRNHARLPVTQPPPRYQTTTQLRQTMERLLAASDPDNLDEDSPDLMWVDVPEMYLDVRLKARVFDFDSLKSLEPDVWASHFHPTLAVYQQNIEPPAPPPAASIEELHVQEVKAAAQRRKGAASPVHSRRAGEPLWSKLEADKVELDKQPATSSEMLFAMGHLADVLLDVVRDPDVTQAYTDLDDTPLRHFCEFSQPSAESDAREARKHFPPGHKVLVQADEGEAAPSGGTVVGHHAGRVGVELEDGTTLGVPLSRVMDPQRLADTLEANRTWHEESQSRQLLQTGEFQCLVEEILAASIFDVIKDAALHPDDPEHSLIQRGHRHKFAKKLAST